MSSLGTKSRLDLQLVFQPAQKTHFLLSDHLEFRQKNILLLTYTFFVSTHFFVFHIVMIFELLFMCFSKQIFIYAIKCDRLINCHNVINFFKWLIAHTAEKAYACLCECNDCFYSTEIITIETFCSAKCIAVIPVLRSRAKKCKNSIWCHMHIWSLHHIFTHINTPNLTSNYRLHKIPMFSFPLFNCGQTNDSLFWVCACLKSSSSPSTSPNNHALAR